MHLRDEAGFEFNQLIDVTAVDYLHYGQAEWETQSATSEGFSRGREADTASTWTKPRFSVVYHLLSLTLNQAIAYSHLSG